MGRRILSVIGKMKRASRREALPISKKRVKPGETL